MRERDRDQLVADFLGELLQLWDGQFLDVSGFVHHVEVSAHSVFWNREVLDLIGKGTVADSGNQSDLHVSVSCVFG